jgi:hypothetical protein
MLQNIVHHLIFCFHHVAIPFDAQANPLNLLKRRLVIKTFLYFHRALPPISLIDWHNNFN